MLYSSPTFQVVAVHTVLFLDVADHRLDGGPALHLAADGFGQVLLPIVAWLAHRASPRSPKNRLSENHEAPGFVNPKSQEKRPHPHLSCKNEHFLTAN